MVANLDIKNDVRSMDMISSIDHRITNAIVAWSLPSCHNYIGYHLNAPHVPSMNESMMNT